MYPSIQRLQYMHTVFKVHNYINSIHVREENPVIYTPWIRSYLKNRAQWSFALNNRKDIKLTLGKVVFLDIQNGGGGSELRLYTGSREGGRASHYIRSNKATHPLQDL